MTIRQGIITIFVYLCLQCNVSAQTTTFVVSDIQIEGLQRIPAGTVFNYLPVKIGDKVDSSISEKAIRELFSTGFFDDVQLVSNGDILIVKVKERPSIATIDFQGNDTIDEEQLAESLTDIGFAVGRVFNKSTFDQVTQELRRAYFARGKYGIEIEATSAPLERNRVAINFDIREGRSARIRKINIVGNNVFEDDELLDLFALDETSLIPFFLKTDQYSKQKLSADLESLRSFYLNRGYLNFVTKSTQVSITPNKEDIYITINVSEGEQFSVDEVRLVGDLIVEEEELFPLVTLREGDVFSRLEVVNSSQSISNRLGDSGYYAANVNAVPEVDEENKLVKLTFFVDPGKRTYVRRIIFKGNTKTRDEVIRRQMRQFEGAWISTSAVQRSKERLDQLGYFEEVTINTPAVPGTDDQVDLEYEVVEQPSGSLSVGAGYSQGQGIVLSTQVEQENFLGTGHRFTFTANSSDVNRTFATSWVNPYFTDDGVSLGGKAFFRRTTASDANLSDYDLDELGFGMISSIPISEYNTVSLNVTGKLTEFESGDEASVEVLEFERETDGEFTTLNVDIGWSNDSRNSRYFPDRGSFTRLGADIAVPGFDLSYYKLTIDHQTLIPIADKWVLSLSGDIGYGDSISGTDELPFIYNFFAGGIRSVRGFETNTLGPRDSRNDALGGAVRLVSNIELFMPVPFVDLDNSLRIGTFFDSGNVFDLDDGIEFDELRHTTGVSATWLSPFGPVSGSLALPLNDEEGDDLQSFQFTFGTVF